MLHDYRTVTAAEVERDVSDGLAALDARVDALVAAPPSSVLEVVQVLDAVHAAANDIVGRAAFAGWVHPDGDVREAGQKAYAQLSAWRGRLPLRDDVAALVLGRDQPPGTEVADPVDARLVAHWERDLRRSGHGLPAATRERVRELRDRLAEIEAQWDVNIAEDTAGLAVTRDELDGLPDSYVEGLTPGTAPGTYVVSLDYPQLHPFLAQARHRDQREALLTRSRNRGSEANRPLTDEGLGVRRELASLLGYETWADYAIEVKMAGTPARAHALLDRLDEALAGPVAAENDELRALLVEDGEPADVRLELWDLEYAPADPGRAPGGARPVGFGGVLPGAAGAGDGVRPARGAARPDLPGGAGRGRRERVASRRAAARGPRQRRHPARPGLPRPLSARGEVQPRRGLRPGAQPTGRRRQAGPRARRARHELLTARATGPGCSGTTRWSPSSTSSATSCTRRSRSRGTCGSRAPRPRATSPRHPASSWSGGPGSRR